MSMKTLTARPFIALGVTLAAFAVLVIAIAIAREYGQVDSLTAKRVSAISIGLVLIAAGNLAPKMGLFHLPGVQRATVMSAERFAGWTLVLTGLAVVGLWVFAPSQEMMLISSAIVVVAFLVVSAAWAMVSLRARGQSETAAGDGHSALAALTKRVALLQILFGLFAAFSIVLADSLWGDSVSRWMAVVYCMLLPFVAMPLFKQLKAHRDNQRR
jgi:hypothetical protein